MFCIKYNKKKLSFKTDNLGGRIFLQKKEYLQVFGDSQVLGLDIEEQKEHYLKKYYEEDLVLYAAPNNGPNEVLRFIDINQDIIDDKIIINLNLAVDLFRILPNHNFKEFVALKDHEIDIVLKYPIRYRFIIFKNLLFKKYFTISRKNDQEMRDLFLSLVDQKLENSLKIYIKKLNDLSNKLNLDFDLILIFPYWMYQSNGTEYNKNKKIEKKLNELICRTINNQTNSESVYVSKLKDKIKYNFLTADKRHFKSSEIDIFNLDNLC